MDITCSKCGMEYSLDDTLISKGGTSVRCMNCNQVFKVYKSGGRGPDEWLLRQSHGPIRTIEDLSVLQQWIHEGKVSPDDLLSQRNGQWKRVGDIEQLSQLFAEARTRAAPAAGRPRPESSPLQSTIRRNRAPRETDTTERFTTPKDKSGSPAAAVGRITPTPPSSAKASKKKTGPKPRSVENDKPTLPPPPITEDIPLTAPASFPDDEVTRTYTKPEALAAMAQSRPSVQPAPQPGPAAATADEDEEDRITQDFTPPKPFPAVQKSAPGQGPETDGRDKAPVIPESGPTAGDGDFRAAPNSRDSVAWDAGKTASVEEPAWAGKSGGLPRFESTMDSMSPSHRKPSRWYIPVLAAAIVGGVALYFFFRPEEKDTILSTMGNMVKQQDQERYKKFFDRGRENFLLDTDVSFLQADREFQKVLALKENDPPTLAALARLYAVWAQYYRDAALDAEADARKGKGRTPKARAEAELLKEEFADKLREAEQWQRQAVAAAPDLKATLLASADIARLKGDLDSAADLLKKAEAKGEDAETRYVAALIAIDNGAPPKETADRLQEAVAGTSMLRGLYRIARIRAATGDNAAAEAQLTKLLALNSAHPQAEALKQRMAAGRPVVLFDKDAAESEGRAAPTSQPRATKEEIATGESDKGVESAEDGSEEEVPKGIPAILKRARRHQNNGRPDAAYVLYQEVLEREPSNADALTGIGYCKLDKGEKGGALASFRRALNNRPSFGPAILGLAETYKSMGNKEQALRFYRDFVAAKPYGKDAEMAKKNIARFEAELGAETTPSPERAAPPRGPADEETVIDDTPPPPATPEETAPAAEPEPPSEPETTAPPEEKPTIIILKKDERETPEE